MSVTAYRLATRRDLPALAAMRWEFRVEETPPPADARRGAFVRACTLILREGLEAGHWHYWVALVDGQIVSQIFVRRVDKIPSPGRLRDEMGYVTNVYTRPDFRNRGIGSELLERVVAWARQQDLEMLFVWPSEQSVPFYRRAGFQQGSEMMELDCRAPRVDGPLNLSD